MTIVDNIYLALPSRHFIFKANNEKNVKTLFWCLYKALQTDFTNGSGVPIVDFEQVNSGRVRPVYQLEPQTMSQSSYHFVI